ncbi:ABC transporter permease [Dehalococcoidia bacterium]|nr:ABC transporter permease [Dehalococcoidia bacterium]
MVKDFFFLATRAVRQRRLRSWLTVIGIVIGITAMVALLSLGLGLERTIIQYVEGIFGVNTIMIMGEMRTRTWEGQDGQKRSRVEVHANRVIFLDRRAVTALPEGEAPEFEEAQETIEPEELPF